MATAALDYTFGLSDEHVREQPNGDLVVSGWASNYDLDRVGDRVTPQSLRQALDGYLANPALLYNHRYSLPAGQVTKAKVDDERGLWIEAVVAKPAAAAPAEVHGYFDMVKRGFMRAFSIGGVWIRDSARRIVRMDLREISIASVGVNSGTLMSAQMAKAFGDEIDLEGRIRELEVGRIRRDLRDLRGAVAEARADAMLLHASRL